MRLVTRSIIGVAAVLFLTSLAIYALRKPIAGAAVERTLAGLRIENATVKVSAVSLSRLSLAEVKAGSSKAEPGLSLLDVAIGYDWRALLFDRKIKSIAIGSGRLAATIDEQGVLDVAGWSPNPDAPPAPPPFNTLSIDGLNIHFSFPGGSAAVELDGTIDVESGGGINVAVTSDRVKFGAVTFSEWSGSASAGLKPGGSIEVAGAAKSDIATPLGVARGVDAKLSASLASWRGFVGDGPRGLLGRATAAIETPDVGPDAAEAFASFASQAGQPINSVSLAGAIEAAFAEKGVSISFAGGPLTLVADRGDVLKISGGDSNFYEVEDGRQRLSLRTAISGVSAGRMSVDAVSIDQGPWRIEASSEIGPSSIKGVALNSFNGDFHGAYSNSQLSLDGNIRSTVKIAKVGRLVISDMPVSGRISALADFEKGTLAISPQDGECFEAERASFKFVEQDMDARVSAALLCPPATPSIIIGWGDAAFTRAEGSLTAKNAYYRLGKTVFDGAPPHVDFKLDYRPVIQTSRITGDFDGGSVLLNDALVVSKAQGAFETDLVRETVAAKVSISTMKIAQNAPLERVSPVKVTGRAALADEIATFGFDVTTMSGVSLGRGEGNHGTRTGIGEATFDSGSLKLSYFLQPDHVIPALRGVISNASGASEGAAKFAWTPTGVRSSATVKLSDVSFRGPGVAVSRTDGVTGALAFSSLSPVTTEGEQTVSIRKIDLDALKLENGEMTFSLPGDDTLRIIRAEFPWFDGKIGAYESQMSIIGGKSEVTLQIANVNLGQLLSYLKIEGLSGDGVINGVLPVSFEDGRARINNGVLTAKGAGVIRYAGDATTAASQSNEQSALAFEILRELRFETLTAAIDGPLDGTLNFKILFEGRSDIPVKAGKGTQRVDSPVRYRISINAPLLSLIEQAVLSTDVKLQIERSLKKEEAAKPEAQ